MKKLTKQSWIRFLRDYWSSYCTSRLTTMVFECQQCHKTLTSQYVMDFLDNKEKEIREENRDWIEEVREEDRCVEDPYTSLLSAEYPMSCLHCGARLLIKIHFTVYEMSDCEFYFSDIAGCRPFLPFQVMTGSQIKRISAQFFLRWLSNDWNLHIVTPFFDTRTLALLSTIPQILYYHLRNQKNITIITRRGSDNPRYGTSGGKVIKKTFDAEDCTKCQDKYSVAPVCLACFQWQRHCTLIVPKYFHAKWYAGISEDRVEVLVSSHNLGRWGDKQPETVGFIRLNKLEYHDQFLAPLGIQELEL